jgi:GNAT superfamily N-acetyltransferase
MNTRDEGKGKSESKAGGEATHPPSVRPAKVGDLPLILGLIRELATYEKLLADVEATEEKLKRTLFPGGGATPAAHVIIGEVDGAPAGFAVYFFNFSTFLAKPGLYLEDLFVRPESRGKGLGKALLLHLAQLAGTLGCGRMEWAVLDWNTPAIEFYRRTGAIPLEDWTIFRLTGDALRGHGTPQA